MRDPKRIDRVLAALRELWYMHPDLRLGQLIDYALLEGERDDFYLEDDAILTLIEKRIKEDSNGKEKG